MHKSRKLLTAAAVSLALSSTASYALTLGDIEMRSALNQTMDAQIRLKPATPSELTGLRVQLASQDAFSRAGLNRSAALNDLKFQVDESLPGAPVIRVTSSRPVVEPFLNFLLEVDWSTGRMVREYTVLLDPPVFLTPNQSQRASITESTTQRASDLAGVPVAIDRTPVTTVDLTNQGVIESAAVGGEIVTLDSDDTFNVSDVVVIAEDSAGFETPDNTGVVTETLGDIVTDTQIVTDSQIISETVDSSFVGGFEVIDASGGAGEYIEGSSNQFAEQGFQPVPGETNLGGEVVTLTDSLSTSDQVFVATDSSVESVGEFDVQVFGDTREVGDNEGAIFVAQETAGSGSTAAGGEITVRSGDTLSQIARANQVGGATTQQMMLALLEANQQAFINGNINLLKAGAILRIPDASAVNSLSQAQALTEVAQQEKLWQEYRDNLRGTSSTRVAQTPSSNEIAANESASSTSDTAASSDVAADSDAAAEEEVGISQSAQDILDQARDELEQARNELRLVGENEATDTASSTSADETDQPETDNLGELNTQLQLAREELESTRLAADELASRDEALSGTAERFDSLVNLRQNEVAKLEQQLADARRNADAATESVDAGGLPEVEAYDEGADTDAIGEDSTAIVTAADTTTEDASTRVVQPAQQPAQESTEAAAGPWYTKLLGDNKLLIALGVGALALLGLLGTMFKRRKSRDQFDAFDQDDVEFIDDFDDEAVMPEVETPEADLDLDVDADESKVGAAVAAGGAGLAAAGAAVAVSADDDDSASDDIDSSLLDSMGGVSDDDSALAGVSNEADLTIDANTGADGMSDDTISEADVYLAYGLHGQAEELLKKAIDEQPDHPEYQEKLLQTYHAQGNSAAFDTQAAEYQQRFGSGQAGWNAVAAMGSELNPTNALYKGAGDSVAAVGSGDISSPSLNEQDFTVEIGDTGMQSDGSNAADLTDFMDQTLDPGAAFEKADLEATGDLSKQVQDLTDNSDSFLGNMGDSAGDMAGSAMDKVSDAGGSLGDAASDLMGDSKAALGGATAGVAGLAAGAAGAIGLGSSDAEVEDLSAMSSGEEGVIEFDASIESKDFDVDAPRGAASDSLDMPSASEGLSMDLDQLSGDLQSDDDLLGGDLEIHDLSAADLTSDVSMAVGDADEMDTMMDLAKAYIDMGDNDSASSALDEIVKSGNPEQRSEAETLLRKIS